MRFYQEAEQRNINNLSTTQALGWSSLFNSFGGSNSTQKSKFTDFLPFQDKESDRKISREVVDTLVELIEEGKLPPKVVGAAQQFPEVRQALGLE